MCAVRRNKGGREERKKQREGEKRDREGRGLEMKERSSTKSYKASGEEREELWSGVVLSLLTSNDRPINKSIEHTYVLSAWRCKLK